MKPEDLRLHAVDKETMLTLDVDGLTVWSGDLPLLAMFARAGSNGVPFTYREPVDPEYPDAVRPVRHARILVVDEGTVHPPPQVH